MRKFGERKISLDISELHNGKRQKENFSGSLNADQRYKLFCKGVYHEKRNPEGLVRMTEFQKNDMGEKSVRFVPKYSNANLTGEIIGTFKEFVRDSENDCTMLLKMRMYSEGHRFHNPNDNKEFMAAIERMKTERLAIEFNTLDKIDRINEETEKMMKRKKKPKKTEIRAELRTLLGDEWFFDDINVNALKDKIEIIQAQKNDENIYNPIFFIDPTDETGKTLVYKMKSQKVIPEWKQDVKIFRVYIPNTIPGQKLKRQEPV